MAYFSKNPKHGGIEKKINNSATKQELKIDSLMIFLSMNSPNLCFVRGIGLQTFLHNQISPGFKETNITM